MDSSPYTKRSKHQNKKEELNPKTECDMVDISEGILDLYISIMKHANTPNMNSSGKPLQLFS